MHMARIDRDELGTKEWNHRHGHQVGSEQGKNNGKSQCGEEIFAYSEEPKNGEKYDACADSCGQHRELNFLSAEFRGNVWRLPHLHMAEDVFKNYNRVIDK